MLMHVMCWLVGARCVETRPIVEQATLASGTNHCLLVSFPLLSELLSRTAPTGRKGGEGFLGCTCEEWGE